MWVKWIRRLEFGDMPYMAREETSKYTDLMKDGNARMFTWVMDAKSVVTSPKPGEASFGEKVFIGYVALPGQDAVRSLPSMSRLMAACDWKAAVSFASPVLDQCLTRFTMPIEWSGEELMVQSRAMDETGCVQPTIDALQAERGVNSILPQQRDRFTWLVNKDRKC